MAETPDEIFERVLAEEQKKGSSPAVALARAKAARVRAQKGLPIEAAAAAAAAAMEPSPPGAEEAKGEPAEAAAEAPAEAEAEAKPAAPAPEPEAAEAKPAAPPREPEAAEAKPAARAPKPEPAAAPPPAAEEPAAAEPAKAPAAGDGREAPAERPAPAPTPAPAREPAQVGARAAAAPPRGRGASARAARAQAQEAVPERVQRLLAVVKPEAIQRVEREPIDRVNVWPHLMAAEFLSLLVITALLVLFSALVDAPFRELANINQTPNPSKAPWYFVGLQELLRYFHPQVAGVLIPQWIILGFWAAPFIDRNTSTRPEDRKLAIVLFTIFILFNGLLIIAGGFFRGPGFNWIYPWDIGVGRIFEL
jgi:menaquinol-cytochrome c reductase cytochrome b/c subunit